MRHIISVLTLLALLGQPTLLAAQSAPAFKVIVHAKNPVTSLSRGELAKIFLKKTTSWSGDGAIAPVDQAVSSGAREAFSRSVHGKGAKAIKQYWNQQIYSGRAVPPPELSSDAKVIAFVAANPGAIGYVSADAVLTDVRQIGVE
jgi:ABC-type phosphate transport system substrate-binding protein